MVDTECLSWILGEAGPDYSSCKFKPNTVPDSSHFPAKHVSIRNRSIIAYDSFGHYAGFVVNFIAACGQQLYMAQAGRYVKCMVAVKMPACT